jgi:peptide/nickel transport system permease protein
MVGLVAVGLAAGAGVPLGLLSGYLGGWADNVIMRVMDGIFAFPALILALGLVAATGAGIFQVMAAIAVVSTPVYARLVRGSTLAVKERDFVLAARSMGAPVSRIIARHIWPNVTAPIIVQASLGIAFAIIAEAGLSFLGLAAVRPPDPTWGSMLRQARDEMARSPVLAIGPGLAIVITVLAFNFVGDGLRDALDPRLRRRT